MCEHRAIGSRHTRPGCVRVVRVHKRSLTTLRSPCRSQVGLRRPPWPGWTAAMAASIRELLRHCIVRRRRRPSRMSGAMGDRARGSH
eukprot:2822150-Prymnesium_polylepis.1